METRKKMTRREFVAAAGGTVVSIGLPGAFIKLMDADNRAFADQLRPDGRPRIPPGQRAEKMIRDMGGERPGGDMASWKLQINGEVQKPMTLSLQDFMALQQVDLTCDVHCVTGWILKADHWLLRWLMRTSLPMVRPWTMMENTTTA